LNLKGQSSIENTTFGLKKTIMGKQEWAKACKDASFNFQKLKIQEGNNQRNHPSESTLLKTTFLYV
jgi:hypothetical protein